MGAPGKTLWGHPNIDFRQERKDRLTEENKSLDMVPLIQREETLEVAVLGYTRKVRSPSEERLKMCVQAKKKKKLSQIESKLQLLKISVETVRVKKKK